MKSKNTITKKQQVALRLIRHEAKTARMGGYTYFVTGHPSIGYTFSLCDPNGATLCECPNFTSLPECLKKLRTVQRHGATTDVRNEARSNSS